MKMTRALGTAAAGVLLTGVVLIPAGPAFAVATGDYSGDGVRIRKCPQTTSSCTVHGLGYRGQGVSVTCYKYGEQVGGTNIWYYHRNRTTGVTGYSHSGQISVTSGTIPRC